MTVGTVLIREVSLLQRWFCTHLYVAGTVGTVLIKEVPLFQCVLYKGGLLYSVLSCSQTVSLPDCSQPLEIHETVAECMIFANHCVAKRIHKAFPSSALVGTIPHVHVFYFLATPPHINCCHGYHSSTPHLLLPWLPLLAAAASPCP